METRYYFIRYVQVSTPCGGRASRTRLSDLTQSGPAMVNEIPPKAVFASQAARVWGSQFASSSQIVLRFDCSLQGRSWTPHPNAPARGINHTSMETRHYFTRYVQGYPEENKFGAQKELFRGFGSLDGLAGLPFKILFRRRERLRVEWASG
ncbi:hypothetical protein BU26DRAFT_522184 [Trematosphaeria pertusa]|uniref:Uncharacterized protein n=1 Tax=Trematosphaeria pertusa TaxID=390896 RepID=A0A6A6I526_9PLEO|nr:uncharacterized protein BU26DRAFT_522184 [Trematosphaeria pertusa]KAF2245062.1 hypothetical protein BU26DRAFT_522184 [Trematosphaeria pertusa]